MNIMTALFDQDEVTKSLVASKARVARQDERQKTRLESIKNVMAKLNYDVHQACDLLNIPINERNYYIEQIEGKPKSS